MNRTHRHLLLLSFSGCLCLCAASCGSGQKATVVPSPPPPAAPVAEAPPPPPRLRLPPGVKPTHYAVDLTVVPSADTFSGTIDIQLTLPAATTLLWLNASELTVREAELRTKKGALPARPVPAGEDFLGFSFAEPAGPGEATLHVRYEGPILKKEGVGLFKEKDGDDLYAFTDFEPSDARRTFPCFDEPSYKVPWQITLHVKKEHVAVANTPVLSETPAPGGMKTVKFIETQPLPSYLLAFAVGPFELLDAGKAGKNQTPVRIITERGLSAQARYAQKTTPELLARLEDYFAIPYPYEKLDIIAVPQFHGAMENAGLVTFVQSGMLASEADETISFRRRFAATCAHELAHQWFGDLVTMAYWEDIWLNESFATWMESKIIDGWQPGWDEKVGRVFSRSQAMGADSLITARKIRQPIESKHDISNAFDGITYGKGAAVLSMFETWIGEASFRKGIQRYLRDHAFANASAEDFLAAQSTEAGKDLRPAFGSFLDQAGVPLVTVALKCDKGAPPALALSQKRYLPVGSQGSAEQTWQVPICVKYAAGKTVGQECTLLTQAQAELPLPAAKACPDWVLPNLGETGYYRVLPQGGLLGKLLKDGGKALTLPERVGVVTDVAALLRTGEVSASEAMGLLPPLLRDRNRHVVASTAGIVLSMSTIVPDELLPNYARLIRKLYGQQARALGFKARPGEDDNTRLLRASLLDLCGGPGEDPALIAEAGKLARRWLIGRQGVDAEVLKPVLWIAARNGDRALFDRIHEEAKKAKDPRERGRLLGAMGAFRDQEIGKAALGILLTDEFDPRESLGILHAMFDERKSRLLAYDFLKQNFDALIRRLPRDSGAHLPRVLAGAFCDEDQRADAEAFFKGRSTRYTGGPRILAQTLERIGLCIAFKRAQQPSLVPYLKKS